MCQVTLDLPLDSVTIPFMHIFSFNNGDGPWGSTRRPSGNGKGNQRRQGAGPSPDQQDLDELLNFLKYQFNRFGGGGNSGGSGGNGGGFSPRIWGYAGLGLAALWLLSGIYVVAPDEKGVVLRFGEYVQTTDSGLHWHLPYPIESVLTPRVTAENIEEIGFRSAAGTGFFGARTADNKNITDVQAESLMLTGDENIVDLDFTVRWRIDDARDFLFNVQNVSDTIKRVSESIMREVIGRYTIDDALTDNKTAIQQEVQEKIQKVLNDYKIGVLVTGAELQQVNPPQQVIDAFRDVQAARADAEKLINQATGYANNVLPRARGQSAQILEQAQAYKQSTIADAQGRAARFTSQLQEYRKAPQVTRERLYYETMQRVLENSGKVILPEGAGGNILPYLPLKGMGPNTPTGGGR